VFVSAVARIKCHFATRRESITLLHTLPNARLLWGQKRWKGELPVCISKYNSRMCPLRVWRSFLLLFGPELAGLLVHFNDCNKSFDTFYRQIAIPPIKRNLLKPKTLLYRENNLPQGRGNILPGIQPLCIKVDGFNHKDLY
jgi:hypothetical protein